MKKFTISLLTALAVGTSSFLGGTVSSAEEAETVTEETYGMSITMEELLDMTDSVSSSNVQVESNENGFMFYDQLDANNKAAYDALTNWLTPTENAAVITLPEPISFSVSSMDMSNWTDDQRTEFWELVRKAFANGESAFEFDYPEIFWYDTEQTMISVGNPSYTYSFRKRQYTMTVNKIVLDPAVYEKYTDVETAKTFEDYLMDKISEFEVVGNDRYSKIKYIHDYIANTVSYNLDSPYRETPYGLFAEPYQIVCEGYSKAVKLLCDKEGIPCVTVLGNYDPSTNIAHMWNYIRMEDGKWYGLDCTWDDMDSVSTPVKYSYFLKGSDTFSSSHEEDKGTLVDLVFPELNDTAYVYSPEQQITTSPTESITTTTTTTITSASETVTTKAAITTTSNVTTEQKTTTVSNSTTDPISTTTTSTSTDTEKPIIKGDFDNDGDIDLSDVVTLKKKLVGIFTITPDDFYHDLNNDAKLNVWDLIILLRTLNL